MQADEVEQARRIGVAMGSKAHGAVIGWTTDAAKADACRDAGMSALPGYNRTGPKGWEIIARPDPPPEEGEDAETTKGTGG
jgi:hypothetical protein